MTRLRRLARGLALWLLRWSMDPGLLAAARRAVQDAEQAWPQVSGHLRGSKVYGVLAEQYRGARPRDLKLAIELAVQQVWP